MVVLCITGHHVTWELGSRIPRWHFLSSPASILWLNIKVHVLHCWIARVAHSVSPSFPGIYWNPVRPSSELVNLVFLIFFSLSRWHDEWYWRCARNWQRNGQEVSIVRRFCCWLNLVCLYSAAWCIIRYLNPCIELLMNMHNLSDIISHLKLPLGYILDQTQLEMT